MHAAASAGNPTDPFAIWEPRNPEIHKIYIFQERRVTDYEAWKLWKGRSGSKQSQQLVVHCYSEVNDKGSQLDC